MGLGERAGKQVEIRFHTTRERVERGKESACNAGDPQLDSCVGKMPWRRDRLPTPEFLGFPYGSTGKESARNAGDLGLIPGLGRNPG